MVEASEITGLLNAAHGGDAAAREAAYAAVYAELKRCAQRQKRLAPGSSLTSTAIVHELFLRLNRQHGAHVESRAHFFALAARAMRQIIVDHARRRQSRKRGGDVEIAALDGITEPGVAGAEQALALDAALDRLARRDPDLARIVEWHFFAGLSFREIGEELARHERTVYHDWELARAFLQESMREAPAP